MSDKHKHDHDDKHDKPPETAKHYVVEGDKLVPPDPNSPAHTHHRDRIKDAITEGIQSEVIRVFQENRNKLAEWILDRVPDAHMHTAENIAKFLPRVAQVFKIATPAGFIWDPVDDIAQDLAQAIKETAERRAGATVAQAVGHAPAHAATPPQPVEPSPRRFFAAIGMLDEAAEDDLRVWHNSLSAEDKTRLYVLCDQLSSPELIQLLSGSQKTLEDAVAQVKLPPKTLTFLQFREEVSKDNALQTRVSSFLAAKGVKPERFWKMVEKYYGNRVKGFEDFKRLMALSDDEVYGFLHLAEFWDAVIRALNGAGPHAANAYGIVAEAAAEVNCKLNDLGLQLQRTAPALHNPRTEPSKYDRFINKLFA